MSCINCRYGLWHIELTSIRYAGLTQLGRELYWQVHCQCQQSQTETVQHVKKISNSPNFHSQVVHWKSCPVIWKRHASQCPLQKYPRVVEKAGLSEDTTKSHGEQELEINTQETEPGPIGEHSQLPAWWDLLTPASRISELLWIDDFYVI